MKCAGGCCWGGGNGDPKEPANEQAGQSLCLGQETLCCRTHSGRLWEALSTHPAPRRGAAGCGESRQARTSRRSQTGVCRAKDTEKWPRGHTVLLPEMSTILGQQPDPHVGRGTPTPVSADAEGPPWAWVSDLRALRAQRATRSAGRQPRPLPPRPPPLLPPPTPGSGLLAPKLFGGRTARLPPTRWHPAASWRPSSLAPLPAPCADSEHTCPHLPLRCQVLPWVLALPPTVASAWGRCTPWLPRDPLGTPNACLMPRPSSRQAARRREEAWRQGPARSLRPRGHSRGRRAAGGPALHHRSETGGCACRRRPE